MLVLAVVVVVLAVVVVMVVVVVADASPNVSYPMISYLFREVYAGWPDSNSTREMLPNDGVESSRPHRSVYTRPTRLHVGTVITSERL